MLLIGELVDFGAGLDEGHHHAVADRAGAAWGLARPRFVRSSASHVFVADRRDGSARVVLRLRPDRDIDVLDRASRAAREWCAAGAPIVSGLSSLRGRMVATTDGYAAMALDLAEGPTLDELDDELPDHAGAWGEALARLHVVRLATPGLPDSPELELPRTPDVFGTVHGDPEADNVVVTGDGLRFVDPDRVRRGWFAADVAFALRDWAPPGGAPDLDHEVPRRFVEGYRRVRPLTDEELSWLPVLARSQAQEELSSFDEHLRARPAPGWPAWATNLDARVRERAAALREALASTSVG